MKKNSSIYLFLLLSCPLFNFSATATVCEQFDLSSCDQNRSCYWDINYGRCLNNEDVNDNDPTLGPTFTPPVISAPTPVPAPSSNPYPWNPPTTNPQPLPNVCSQCINPVVCERTIGCKWNPRQNRCDMRFTPTTRPSASVSCNNNHNRYDCEKNSECNWNQLLNSCEGRTGYNGHDGVYHNPSTRECSIIDNPQVCTNTPGCEWDNFRHCYPRWPLNIGGPGNHGWN
ncbi:MAG: hypothetical protein HQK53_09935 [Oligoflexia bacterium]|nr:hypothetical protein [Oligoflexia bacterium]